MGKGFVQGNDSFKEELCCHPIEDKPEVLDLAAQAGSLVCVSGRFRHLGPY